MKKVYKTPGLLAAIFLSLLLFSAVSCQRDDDDIQDDLPQEEITNVLLNVENLATGEKVTYNYSLGAGTSSPIKLQDGGSYKVTTVFLNGTEDVTEEIEAAKDEHFLIYDFPRSQITLTRLDGPQSTGANGKVGLITRWDVTRTVATPSPLVIVRLVHDAATASEGQNGTAWGSVTGGETDAEATFSLKN